MKLVGLVGLHRPLLEPAARRPRSRRPRAGRRSPPASAKFHGPSQPPRYSANGALLGRPRAAISWKARDVARRRRTAPPAGRPAAAPRAGARTASRGPGSSGRPRSRTRRPPARASSSSVRSQTNTSAFGRSASRAFSTIDAEPSTAITLPSRQALLSSSGDAAAAAARVEHGLVAARAAGGRAPRAPTRTCGVDTRS